MGPIILDDELRAKLNGLKEPVEVREPGGKLIGQFVPQAAYVKLLYAWAKTLFTDAEIAEAKQKIGTGPVKTLAQILKEREQK